MNNACKLTHICIYFKALIWRHWVLDLSLRIKKCWALLRKKITLGLYGRKAETWEDLHNSNVFVGCVNRVWRKVSLIFPCWFQLQRCPCCRPLRSSTRATVYPTPSLCQMFFTHDHLPPSVVEGKGWELKILETVCLRQILDPLRGSCGNVGSISTTRFSQSPFQENVNDNINLAVEIESADGHSDGALKKVGGRCLLWKKTMHGFQNFGQQK